MENAPLIGIQLIISVSSTMTILSEKISLNSNLAKRFALEFKLRLWEKGIYRSLKKLA